MSFFKIEPYNAVLTMTRKESFLHTNNRTKTCDLLDLMENTDETFCFDNMALFDILHKKMRLPSATYDDVNHLLAHVMIGLTACFRFPGDDNSEMLRYYFRLQDNLTWICVN